MFFYVLKRLVIGSLTLVVASVIVFASVTSANGDPRDRLATCIDCDQSAYDDDVETFRLDEPFVVQYLDWVKRIGTGNLEPASSQGDQPVIEVTFARLVNTLWLVAPAWVMATLLTMYLSLTSVSNPTKVRSALSRLLGIWGLAVPAFLTGLMLQTAVVLVADRWGFKPFRSQGLKAESPVAFISSAVLPVTILVLMLVSRRYAVIRTAVEAAFKEPHIEAAIARGVPRRQIITRHIPRLVSGPFFAGTLSEISLLLGGAVVVETVFAWPGVGQLLLSSLRSSDIELSLFLAIVPVVVVLLSGILIDVAQAIIDPRIREWRK